MHSWRIFYTAPRSEKKCEQRLLEQQIEVLLPKVIVRRQWKDRKKAVTEPLFRSYIFAHVDEKERLEVLKVKGIVKSLMFGGRLAEMTLEEIEKLKITQQDPAKLGLADQWLPAVGKTVLVTEGPMKGLSGEVLQHRGQSYVVVRIEALRQAVKVNVPAEWIKEVKPVRLQT